MIYEPSPTGKKFHEARDIDSGFVRALIGPIGSGKSVTCVLDLIIIATEQEPDMHGIRRTRFAIIRNTYRELLDTTVATFFTWIPQNTGHWSNLNMSFNLKQELPDNTTIETEFLFRALDKPDDIKKLLSLEITAAWINEGREISLAVFDMVQGRVGRYPPPVLGVQPTYFGVLIDTNPPDSDHWFYRTFEEDIASNHKLFKQPSGTSTEAENLQNLPRNYYQNISSKKTKTWIDVYVHGKYGFVVDGKPIWPEYSDDVHYINSYTPSPQLKLYIGIDFGLTPAATFGQLETSGRFVVFDELCTFDMGAVSFGKILRQKLTTEYRDFVDVEIYGDPAGEGRAQSDESTPFQMLHNQGIMAFPTYTNDFSIRREVVADYMMRMDFQARPAFAVTSGAPTLRKALAGGYKYKRLQVSGMERYHDVPDKSKYSHVGDSVQYLMLGAVGDGRVIGGSDNTPIDYSRANLAIV